MMVNSHKYSGLSGRVNNNHIVPIKINTIHDSALLSLAPRRSSRPRWCIPGCSHCYLGQE